MRDRHCSPAARSLTAYLLMVCLFLLSAGCGDRESRPGELHPPAGWPSVTERTVEPGHAPTPFTWEQIRDACPAGLRIVMEVKEGLSEPFQVIQEFAGINPYGAYVTTTRMARASGRGGESRTLPQRWKDLQRQTSTAKDDVVITEETITVPGGTFRCMLYTVHSTREIKQDAKRLAESPILGDSEPTVEEIEDRMWYAYELPGPPVMWIKSVGEAEVMRTTLISRSVRAKQTGSDAKK